MARSGFEHGTFQSLSRRVQLLDYSAQRVYIMKTLYIRFVDYNFDFCKFDEPLSIKYIYAIDGASWNIILKCQERLS